MSHQLDANVVKFLEVCTLGTAGVDPIPLFLDFNWLHSIEDILSITQEDLDNELRSSSYKDDGSLLPRGLQVKLSMSILYLCFRTSEDNDYGQIQHWSKTEFIDWSYDYRSGKVDKASITKAIGKKHVTTASSTMSRLDTNVLKFLEVCTQCTANVDPILFFLDKHGLYSIEDILNIPQEDLHKYLKTLSYKDDGSLLPRDLQLKLYMSVLYLCS